MEQVCFFEVGGVYEDYVVVGDECFVEDRVVTLCCLHVDGVLCFDDLVVGCVARYEFVDDLRVCWI